jgi:hypothetical protein
MEYLKTHGTGFGFTSEKSEAMRFETPSAAGRMRNRLMHQFTNYTFAVQSDETGHYVTVYKQS